MGAKNGYLTPLSRVRGVNNNKITMDKIIIIIQV